MTEQQISDMLRDLDRLYDLYIEESNKSRQYWKPAQERYYQELEASRKRLTFLAILVTDDEHSQGHHIVSKQIGEYNDEDSQNNS